MEIADLIDILKVLTILWVAYVDLKVSKAAKDLDRLYADKRKARGEKGGMRNSSLRGRLRRFLFNFRKR